MTRPIRIGTRGSALALWQARTVSALLAAQGCAVDLAVIRTAGDRLQDHPHQASIGKGVFVKEIEDALLTREIDVAVHSAKDMPAAIPDGLAIAGVLPREDSRDALVLRNLGALAPLEDAIAALGETPLVGTSSVRRSAQLEMLMPRVWLAPVGCHVDTRLLNLAPGDIARTGP